MAENKILLPNERIERLILVIRGHKVILDTDLAELYGVETKALNRAFLRNRDRFPSDFLSQLSAGGVRELEAPIWHLKMGWPPLSPLRIYRAGGCHVIRRSQKQTRGSSERRNHADFRSATSDPRVERTTRATTRRFRAEI